MAVDAAALLDLAATLPETGERDWLDHATAVTFRGRGIAFVSDDGSTFFVKCTLAERDALVRSAGDVYSEWWTSGRFGWVEVRLDRADAEEVNELLVEAWRLTAPQRLVRELDAAGSAVLRPPRSKVGGNDRGASPGR